jgi:mono/diheme cytochrome c family protein
LFPRRRPAATICGFGLAVSVGLLALVAVRAEEAAVLFARACASCHGKDGKARTPIGRKLKVKDLTQSMIGDREIAEQIREGKKGQDDLTRMPSFKESLKGDEIEALVRYVKSLRARVPAKPGGGK